MAKVIERFGHEVDEAGFLRYDDRLATWEQAEKLAGHRLDRRKNYAIVGGKLCESASWSERCSGCCPDDPYCDHGCGCHECGYTGRRRTSMWLPLSLDDLTD